MLPRPGAIVAPMFGFFSLPVRFCFDITDQVWNGRRNRDFGPVAELENPRGFVRAASPFSVCVSYHFSSYPSPLPLPFLLYHFMLRYSAASTLDYSTSGILPFRSRLGAELASSFPLRVGIPARRSRQRRRSGGVLALVYGTILL